MKAVSSRLCRRCWLESQLAATQLPDLVRKLEELHGPSTETTTLTEVLGSSTTQLQTEGLTALNCFLTTYHTAFHSLGAQ